MTLRSEWRNRHTFAEAAEALGVDTTSIMGMIETDTNMLLVLYTTDTNSEYALAWHATLQRDDYGVFRLHGEPVEVPGLLDYLGGLSHTK